MKSNSIEKDVIKYATEIKRRIASGADTTASLEYAKSVLSTITESEFVYIGEILNRKNLQTKQNPNGFYLHMIVIDDISWDEESRRRITEGTSKGIEFSSEDTLYGLSLTQGKTIISNNVVTDQRRGGICKLPKNHPAITTFAAIPLIFCGKSIGQIGLANRKKPYTEEFIQSIELLILIIANIVNDRKDTREKQELIHKEEMMKAKNLFMANISHEIRTPLNSIIGMLSLIEDSNLNEVQAEYTDIAKRSSYALLALINDILDINKLEASKMTLNIKSMNLKEIVEKSIDVVLGATSLKNIPIKSITAEDLPENVMGDSERIRQMLINLINNAVKFTERGQVTVKVEKASIEDVIKMDLRRIDTIPNLVRKTSSASDTHSLSEQTWFQAKHVKNIELSDNMKLGKWHYIKFSVIDTGIGIKSSDINKLFQSFVQLDASNTREYGGTGLGLSIVHKLCDLMNGGISLVSDYGIGSTFYFILPMQEVENKIAEVNMSVLDGINVLVVDDLMTNIIRVNKLLDRHNIDHRESTDPHTAFTMYVLNKRYTFNIGLIDMVMPRIDGNKLAEMISKSENPFPLIALSSLDESVNDIGQYFADHIRKPFTDDQLLRTMVRVLERHNKNSPQRINSSSSDSIDCDIDIMQQTPRKKSTSNSTPTEMVYSGVFRGRGKNIKKERPYYEPAENFGINILVVDDVKDNVNVLVGFLNKLGYRNITVANNGAEAVDIVSRGAKQKKPHMDFHVILMDILMPVMDGITAAKKISELFADKNSRPVIIAVTAANVESSIADGIHQYMDGIITKPIVEIDRLGQALKNISV